MSALPDLPYGAAKTIVVSMRIGDTCLVRPKYVPTFRYAAAQIGAALICRPVRRARLNLYWLKRCAPLSPVRTRGKSTAHFVP